MSDRPLSPSPQGPLSPTPPLPPTPQPLTHQTNHQPPTTDVLSLGGWEGGPGEGDRLVTAVMVAIGTVPTRRQMAWMDDAAAEFGEDPLVKALMWAAEHHPPHRTLSEAVKHLRLRSVLAQRRDVREREERLTEARRDREVRPAPAPVQTAKAAGDPQPLRALLGDLPWLERR